MAHHIILLSCMSHTYDPVICTALPFGQRRPHTLRNHTLHPPHRKPSLTTALSTATPAERVLATVQPR
eukprot:265268-Chlamydomonas_euryale.AAC.6